ITSTVPTHRVPGLSIGAGLLTPDTKLQTSRPCRAPECLSRITTSALVQNFQILLCSHAGHSAATHPQELRPPLPCGPTSTN
ncbi:Hypothetical predicted protein, partial [Marmota monax]